MSHLFKALLLSGTFVVAITACGLKGPLRLPEKTAPATVTPAPNPQATTHNTAPQGASDDKINQPLPKAETDNKSGSSGK